MKFIYAALCFVIATGASCSNQTASSPLSVTRTSAAPQDKEVVTAEEFIEKVPDSPIGYNRLAVVYIKKARETGNVDFNSKAESAVKQALLLAPGDQTARKLTATLDLSGHRFSEALEIGQQLEKELPDDPFVYGILTDANAELGNYPAAVAAAQKMVDLRPNSLSYARVAHLRSLHGDHNGAVEMYKIAVRTTDPQDREAQSWGLVQLANEYWRNGKYDQAEKGYDEALSVLPDYHLALAGKGRLAASQGKLDAAATLLTAAKTAVSDPNTIILLGDVFTVAGEPELAREQYDLVENGEEKLGSHHDAHRLALFWADHTKNLDEALKIAREDYAQIKDIYAADILAWCLYQKGQLPEAKEMITQAMRLGTNDARLHYHAGMIDVALGNKATGRRSLKRALELNPGFDLVKASKARQVLQAL